MVRGKKRANSGAKSVIITWKKIIRIYLEGPNSRWLDELSAVLRALGFCAGHGQHEVALV